MSTPTSTSTSSLPQSSPRQRIGIKGGQPASDYAGIALAALGVTAIGAGIKYFRPDLFSSSKRGTKQLLHALQVSTDQNNRIVLESSEIGAGPLPEEYFGLNVFDKRAQQKYIPAGDFQRLHRFIQEGRSIDQHLADVVAAGMMAWARERGATHFAHWYQPISEHTGQKHDTFLDVARDHETPMSKFSGSQLIINETDGSSAPNGSLRSTHTARAYLAWDPTVYPYVIAHAKGATLYIPSILFSWKDGQSLDEKIPLLRSETAVAREVIELFQILGDDYTQHNHLTVNSGLEQEFFLIDRRYYSKRPDLQLCGRTLQGAPSPRGQELEDNYYSAMSPRYLDAIHDFERECWKLGIPLQTRHKEVAPGQYEIAPKYAPANMATDRNVLMMQIFKNVAHRHGLAVLFHEKPFKGVNGSGKHNNWSLGTNKTPTVFQPGPVPDKNPLFMLFLAATIKAVDTHGDLMRAAIAGAANDHRLGANEAPPAIVSVYLGGDIQQAVDRYVNGHTDAPQLTKQLVDLGIPVLPEVKKDTTDRNRTSTFAFTNNKFEFRAVGSSQNPSRTNQVLNTIVADSVKQLGEEIYKEKQRGASTDAAIKSVVSKALKKHMRVVYDGNGYSEEWPIEAKRRGLPNLRQTPEALDVLSDQKNIDLYERVGVLSKAELLARQEILYEEYQKKISIEGKCLAGMARNHILPAAIEYQSKCAEAISNVNNDQATKNQQSHLQEITKHINTALGAVKHLDEVVDAIEKQPSPKAMAHYANKSIKPALDTVREPLDALEQLLPRSLWPFPVYHEMLFHQD